MGKKKSSSKRGPAPSPITVMELCARSGGRCQFKGCNKVLFRDGVTLKEFNNTNVAHIVASSPDGPRGDIMRSHQLSDKLSNLMLMCWDHHHMVDEDVKTYTEDVLRSMKLEQEKSVESVCEALNAEPTHLLSLRSKIKGEQEVTLCRDQMLEAILPEKRPAGPDCIGLDVEAAHFYRYPEFWRDTERLLKNKFDRFVGSVVETDKNAHFSVFPLAPIPVIIKLGYMMGDKIRADVFQKRRSPDTWKWQPVDSGSCFLECRDPKPMRAGKGVSLVFSLSAAIPKERRKEFAKHVGARWMYEVCATRPGVDCISSRRDLSEFWHTYQQIMEVIRQDHPRCRRISVLAAAPVSAAFEIGRRYMSGVYPIMDIYDDYHAFFKALTIGEEYGK